MDKDLSFEPRRTTWGAAVQTANYTRVPLEYIPNSTLNEKYEVGKDIAIDNTTEFPHVAYFGYGRGSTYMQILSDGSSESTSYIHEPVDAALYYQMPFVLRTLDNDITQDKRSEFAIRALVEVNEVSYVAYFLKKLYTADSTISLNKIIPATSDTDESSTPLVGDPAYLNPQPTTVDSGKERTDGMYVRVTTVLESKIDSWTIDEMINAKQILTGNSQLEITEVGLFSAIQKPHTSSITGQSITYTEAVRAQLNLVSPHRIMLNNYIDRELVIQHDLGVDDPTSFNFVS